MDNQERILNKLDSLSVDVGVVKEKVHRIEDHLTKLNGSVQRHTVQIGEHDLAFTRRESMCSIHANDIQQVKTKLDSLEKASKIDSASMVKIALIASATALAIAGASGPVVQTVTTLLAK